MHKLKDFFHNVDFLYLLSILLAGLLNGFFLYILTQILLNA